MTETAKARRRWLVGVGLLWLLVIAGGGFTWFHLTGAELRWETHPEFWELRWHDEHGVTVHADDGSGYFRTRAYERQIGPMVVSVAAKDAGIDDEEWIMVRKGNAR